jgi:hypothetical protein
MVQRSAIRSVGRLSALAIAMIASFVLVVMSMVLSRADNKLVHDAKNWVLLAVSIVAFFALLRSSSIVKQPQRSVLAVLLVALLAYVSLQDIMEPGYVLSPLTVSASLLQLIVLLVFIAPLLVRMLGVRLPDLPASGVLSYPYRR